MPAFFQAAKTFYMHLVSKALKMLPQIKIKYHEIWGDLGKSEGYS